MIGTESEASQLIQLDAHAAALRRHVDDLLEQLALVDGLRESLRSTNPEPLTKTNEEVETMQDPAHKCHRAEVETR